MGEPANQVDAAGELLRAVAAYRLSVEDVVDLKTEGRALARRIKEIPDEIGVAEQREAEARKHLLQAARGARYGTEAVNQIEAEISGGRTRIVRAGNQD